MQHPIRLNLGHIEGGDWASSVPTRCLMELRCGFYPDVTATAARAAIEARLSETAAQDPRQSGIVHRIR